MVSKCFHGVNVKRETVELPCSTKTVLGFTGQFVKCQKSSHFWKKSSISNYLNIKLSWTFYQSTKEFLHECVKTSLPVHITLLGRDHQTSGVSCQATFLMVIRSFFSLNRNKTPTNKNTCIQFFHGHVGGKEHPFLPQRPDYCIKRVHSHSCTNVVKKASSLLTPPSICPLFLVLTNTNHLLHERALGVGGWWGISCCLLWPFWQMHKRQKREGLIKGDLPLRWVAEARG